MKLTEGMILKVRKIYKEEYTGIANNTYILLETSLSDRVNNYSYYNWNILELETGRIFLFGESFIQDKMIEFCEENLDKV